jgi:hypothetical protein
VVPEGVRTRAFLGSVTAAFCATWALTFSAATVDEIAVMVTLLSVQINPAAAGQESWTIASSEGLAVKMTM